MEVTLLIGDRCFVDKLSLWIREPQRGEIVVFSDACFVYSSYKLIRLLQKYIYGPPHLAKRVIGVPGDCIHGIIENDKPRIYINGIRIDESYLNPYPLLGVWRHGIHKMVSYDPTRAYDQQILYRVNPEYVMRVSGDKINAILSAAFAKEFTVDPQGRILQFPDVASQNHWGGGSDEFYIELGPNQFWVMGDNRRGSTDSRSFGPISDPHALMRWCIWSHDSDEAWWIWDLIKHPIDFWTRMRWNRFFDILR